MSELSNIDLRVCYEDAELIKVRPFAVGVWRFSDADDLEDLGELATDSGLTKSVIERYGRAVLCVDLDGEEDSSEESRRRLQEICWAMPVSDSSVAALYMDERADDMSSLYVYGDDIPTAIEKLVSIKLISEADACKLSGAYYDSMEADGFKVFDRDAARASAIARITASASSTRELDKK